MAFKRHATSKIHNPEDLFRIYTLGFRGEALPSIASVSQIELETATKDETTGSKLELKGGSILSNKEAPLRVGTKITVKNLFYNTPARLKYVKSLQTEISRIGDILNRLALSHPHIAFTLISDENKLLATSGKGDLKTTIAGVYGIGNARKMLEITTTDLDFEVHGFISLPELTRANRNYLSIIINGRYIKNYQLNKAILSGYGSKIMGGRFPLAVVTIKMDPLLIDVNVHPTKQEVRLSKERELMLLIDNAIKDALKVESLIPETSIAELKFKQKIPVAQREKAEQTTLEIPTSKYKETTGNLKFNSFTGQFFVKEEPEKEELPKTITPLSETIPKIEVELEEESAEHPELTTKQILAIANNLDKKVNTKRFPDVEFFGQMHGTYLFAQSQEGLYIIDQHAAQERIKYEYYREKIGDVSDDLQELLIPIILDFPNNDAILLKEKKKMLEEVGIYLEEYGQNSFILRTHPTWYPQGNEEKTALEMIDIMLSTGEVTVKKFREELAIMMSCKRSIKANHYLNDIQARVLIEDLKKCANPFNCPHGRPTLVHLNNYEMQRMFKRIQDPHESFKV
jgi:DNA mismatch repair protein MutL